ncbi:MAG: hypothetical protein ACLSFW_24165 [Bacteroides cellulosilyticus]
MERKEQTGHICRWMALGIMTAIVIVGCTIVIGLFEWRDRKEIECRNAELHQWRKNVHDLNLHITELSLLGEMVADWDSTDVNEYHSLRLEVDSMLEGIAGICPKEDSDTICRLLAEKEQLLLDIKRLLCHGMNATQEKLTAGSSRGETGRIRLKAKDFRLCHSRQSQRSEVSSADCSARKKMQ